VTDPALPERLVALHLECSPGDIVTLEGDVPDDLVVGAGFERVDERHVRRLHTLPDRVGPSMRLLVCGLNPSLYSAERGIGFARPGNRFWPAMLEAGLATVDRDPAHALHHHGIGMTDLVKRATTAAAELTADEYAAGVERVARLCAWLRPRAVCMVGLAGWRAAVDRRAAVGWQAADLGGVGVYVMPSTSGLNASTQLPGFVAHLRAAADATPGSHRRDR
jgi:TDG/mug DNA glycosylase family protein